MRDNPFTTPILAILKQNPAGLSEHLLIRRLEAQGVDFDEGIEDANLALFQTHFLVMNALYRLQEELLSEGLYLAVDPLCIRIEPARKVEGGLQKNGAEAKLKAYYLDWSQLARTGSTEVESLLDGFWERYLAIDKRTAALNTLEVTGEEGWEEIQRRYRRLAAEHHPDRGGDPERFMAIREAYEILRHSYTV